MSRKGDEGGGRAAVLDFWRSVELFAGQDAPRVNDEKRVYRVGEEGLPWEARHPLRDQWIGDKQVWQHVVYCGVYSREDAFDEIRRAFPPEGDVYDEGPPAGYSALAVFVVDDDGRAILGSQVLASCAWAIARALRHRPSAVGTGEFEEISARFGDRFEEMFGADEDDEDAQELQEEGHTVGAVLDVEALEECLEMVIELLDVDQSAQGSALSRAAEIRVASRRVSIREGRQVGERELLNSFFAADLRKVADAVRRGQPGAALRSYLTSAQDIDTARRVDVERDLRHVRRVLSAARVPAGRWPSVASQQLALGQQYAVNSILAAEAKGSAGGGTGSADDAHAQRVFAVNGPPGTGKTVMLRDLLAAIVVERATLLADLDRPADAFRGPCGWSAGSYRRTVHPLKPHLTGFEVVLACATNAAAENVTVEIPALDAIHPSWRGKLDHFAEIATAMLGGDPDDGGERQAWALIAAALGSRSRNKVFVNRFWWGGLKDLLRELDAPEQEWPDAVAEYRAALGRVEDIRAARRVYSDLFDRRDAAEGECESEGHAAARARTGLADAEARLQACREAVKQARREQQRCEEGCERHRQESPGIWERIRTAGRVTREWFAEATRLADALAAAERAVGQAEAQQAKVAGEADKLAREAEQHEQLQAAALAQAEELARQIPDAGAQWSAEHPDVPFPDEDWEQPSERPLRERHPPWVDEDWNQARTELFLVALRLHRAFVEGAARQMRDSLAAFVDLLSGKAPADLAPATALAAWQNLFLLVPLVSTTFASFPYLFRHLGQGALGWLLVDEAGQATPQSAAGPIWRAQRAVVVGDPLQLEPIDPLPLSIQTILREHHHIPAERLPLSPSVQRLADQLAPAGTLRGAAGEELWVGTPLNVHRRCEEPMFAIVNHLAYQDQMIDCTPARDPLTLPESHWIDVPRAPASSNWVPAEGEALDELLATLLDHAVDFRDVFLISPFRDVAAQIRRRRRDYPGLVAGTIHTAQGREADVVILVLGGNPSRPRARAWAAEKPNLLNVAASRARRRLYVIGDHNAWGKLPHFDVLARELDVRSVLGA